MPVLNHGLILNCCIDIKPNSQTDYFSTNTLLFSNSEDRSIVGSLTLYYSSVFYKRFYRSGERILFSGLALFWAILFVSLLLLNLLLRPLWHLTSELRDFSVDRIQKIPVLAGPRSSEIERVKDAINDLLDIQMEYRHRLEKKVEERTHDLSQSNAALSESEEKYRNLVERSNDGIIIVQCGLIKYINPKGALIVGYDVDQLCDQPIEKFISSGRQKQHIMERYLSNIGEEKSSIYETTLCRNDGQRVYVELNDGPIQYLNTPAYLVIVRDISERKRMERELVKTKNLESLGILAGGIAHDFNNLLTAVFGYIDLARNVINPQDNIYFMLSEAMNASELAQHLTRQLLTFSKGGSPLYQSICFVDLVRDCCSFALSGSNIWSEESSPKFG